MCKSSGKLILIMFIIIMMSFSCAGQIFAGSSNIPLRNKIDRSDDFSGIPLKGGVKIDHKSQVVTLNLRNSDLRQVLRMLANKAGMNVIIHDSIRGPVTLDLMEVELNKAFEYIMMMNNLTYWKDGNTLIIADNNSAVDLGLRVSEIRSIKIKYTDAQKVASFLNNNIFSINRPNTSKNAIVTTNPNTNEILIFGSDDDIKLAEKVVDYLDVKTQVRNYEVNFADPVSIASKICWTVFKSSDGESDISQEGEPQEGSQSKLVCGDTSKPEGDSSSNMEDFTTPSYWVLADTGLNQVTIYGGTNEQLNMADEIIQNFDKREKQVYLEVSIIELSENDSKDLEWQYNMSKVNPDGTSALMSFLGGTFQIQDIQNLVRGGGRAYVYDSDPDDGDNPPFVQTVINKTRARLLANPRIITANNVKASINISEDIVQSVTSTTSSDLLVTQEVQVGPGDAISFSILPKISHNGYVTISIPDFTLSSFLGTSEAGGAAAGLTASREVEVKAVRIKDGDTLVIGGLVQEREQIEKDQMPFVSDIPIIGALFQQQNTKKFKTEVIIMITPRILKDTDEIEPV